MNAPEEGVEQLDVRTMWPHEARSFTPWLAKNLPLLGAELGLKLELIQTEHRVVSLVLDILAEEPDTGRTGRHREPVGMDRHHPSRPTAHLRHLP